MARAKRTDRAAARRRYRAERQLVDDELELDDDAPDAASAPASKKGSTPASASSSGRLSISDAFRQSFRPLDVRGDLAALPTIAVRSKALWLPVLITIGSTVAIALMGSDDLIAGFMFAYFVQAPAIGGVFLAGFLAPRASWLLGVIVGLVSVACYAVLILFFPLTVATRQPTPEEAQTAILSALTLSPIMGAFFAAAAAWYRRFLNLTSPNRGRKAQEAAKAQRPDGKTRSSGAQKASARR